MTKHDAERLVSELQWVELSNRMPDPDRKTVPYDREGGEYMHWQGKQQREHDFSAIRAMFVGFLLSLPFWLIVAAVWLKITGRW